MCVKLYCENRIQSLQYKICCADDFLQVTILKKAHHIRDMFSKIYIHDSTRNTEAD